jgi:hypothetical protein
MVLPCTFVQNGGTRRLKYAERRSSAPARPGLRLPRPGDPPAHPSVKFAGAALWHSTGTRAVHPTVGGALSNRGVPVRAGRVLGAPPAAASPSQAAVELVHDFVLKQEVLVLQ